MGEEQCSSRRDASLVRGSIDANSKVGRGAHELVLHDHSSLKLLIRKISSRRDMSIASDVAFNDGQWHHVAVTWRSAGGRWRFMITASQVFGGPYRATFSLAPGGIFVIEGRRP